MSFGFSIGDFITVIELANTIRKDFSGAPRQYQSIATEVKNLTSVLQDIDTFAAGNDITSQEANLCSIVENCYTILQQLKDTLNKYSSLDSKNVKATASIQAETGDIAGKGTQVGKGIQAQKHALKRKVLRVWDQVRFEPDEIRDFRTEISSNVGLLNAAISSITRDNVIKLVVQHENQEDLAILDWLASSDYAAQQASHICSRLDDTGKWLFDSLEYQEWFKSSDGSTILFLQGIPGSGKTILSSAVVEQLQQKCQGDQTIRLCYFYCDYSRSENQQLVNVMLTLLRQLAEHSIILPAQIKDLYKKHQAHKTRPNLKEIKTTILAVIGRLHLYLVVDALDECQSSDGCQRQLITEILDLQETAGAHVMVTSRPIPQVLDRFRVCGSVIEIEVIASEGDVRKYIDMHIEELPRFVVESLELQNFIKDSIVEAVEGMFLLAKLHLESLKGTTTKKSLRGVLRSFRQGRGQYTEAYSKTMETISRQYQDQRDLAIETIAWIVYAKRPLKAVELLHALAIETGEPEFDEENVPDLGEVISMCCGLVAKEAETETMRLIHYTTQEFFEGKGSVWLDDVLTKIHKSCITYLSLNSFSTGMCHSVESFMDRRDQFPFYDYASCYWGPHIITERADFTAIQRFLRLSGNIQATVQALLETRHDTLWIVIEDQLWTGLHLLTYLDLQELVQNTLHMWNLESADCRGRTALMYTAIYDREAIARVLVEYGAHLDALDFDRATALTIAARYKRTAICQFLIQKGPQVNIEAAHRTPLMAASERDMPDIVQLLLEKGADIDTTTHRGESALILACRQGRTNVAQILIDKGANLDLATYWGATSLSEACRWGCESTIQYLIEHGAEVNTADIIGVTPLMSAAGHSSTSVVQLLIDHGSYTESVDNSGRTALMIACTMGQETTVRLLIEKCVRLDQVDDRGYTALKCALEQGYKGIAELLIENGAQYGASEHCEVDAQEGNRGEGL